MLERVSRGPCPHPWSGFVILHLVLFTPHPTLSHGEREALAKAMEEAFTATPEIARVRVGRRRVLGTSYDDLSPVQFEFLTALEFATLEDLTAYLKHPTHRALSERFRGAAKLAFAHDFEIVEADQLRTLVDPQTLS